MPKSQVQSSLSRARSAATNIVSYASSGNSVQAAQETEDALKRIIEALDQMTRDLYP